MWHKNVQKWNNKVKYAIEGLEGKVKEVSKSIK
jgi:hypothetical protein